METKVTTDRASTSTSFADKVKQWQAPLLHTRYYHSYPILYSGMHLRLPDLLSQWKWKGRINPLHEEVSVEGDTWIRSFTPFTPKSQRAFDLVNIGLLAGRLLPEAGRGMPLYQ